MEDLNSMDQMPPVTLDANFPEKASELTLQFTYPPGKQAFSFKNNSEPLEVWQRRCKDKLVELLNCHVPAPCTARELRQTQFGGVAIKALVMRVSEALSIPAYLLLPEKDRHPSMAVMAIHGHGEVESSIGGGDWEDYHHPFALKVAQLGPDGSLPGTAAASAP